MLCPDNKVFMFFKINNIVDCNSFVIQYLIKKYICKTRLIIQYLVNQLLVYQI